MEIWSKFEYTDYLWNKSIHTIKNLIEDWEWKLIIWEDWKDYWYIWEKDKKKL